MKKLAVPAIVMLLASSAVSAGQDADDARRKAISAKGVALFKNTGNHCHAFPMTSTLASIASARPCLLLARVWGRLDDRYRRILAVQPPLTRLLRRGKPTNNRKNFFTAERRRLYRFSRPGCPSFYA
ncbi:hypothetical protein [Mesorhizobium sp. 1B3]|uniref:hypothetical protein n=1 Tax=Mesorhizobium sp. 1B3 TaxID=3243599 RepID=UPI003D977F04